MKRLPNYRSPNFIRDRIVFQGSNLWSVRDECGYRVFSYSTCIAAYVDDVWYINDTYYSHRTSVHQGYVKRGLQDLILQDKVVHLYHLSRGSVFIEDRGTNTPAMRMRINRLKDGQYV